MTIHSDFSVESRFKSHLSVAEEQGYRRLWQSVLYQMVFSAFSMDATVQPFEVRAARSYLTSQRNKDRDAVLELAGFDPDSWRTKAIPRLEKMFAQEKSYSNVGKGRGCKGQTNAINTLFEDLGKIDSLSSDA